QRILVLFPILNIGRRLEADIDILVYFGFWIFDFRFSIPRWNAMSPPNLSADAPVWNVHEPLLVNFLPMLREEADEMFFNNRERFLRFRIMQKPLLAKSRLDRDIAAIAEANIVLVGLGFRKQSPFLQ